ncbi:MAG: hypothetical protein QM736_08570 [Vicinamibacterales bacterium]
MPPPAVPASSLDDTTEFPPPDGTVALNLGAAAAFLIMVVVALAFDWVALKAVIVVGFLSVALAYLLLPLVLIMRREAPPRFHRWRPSRILAVLTIYAAVALMVTPIWGDLGATELRAPYRTSRVKCRGTSHASRRRCAQLSAGTSGSPSNGKRAAFCGR